MQASFDDVCYMDSVITRVALSEVEPEKFAISKSHIKQTKKLLKEALAAERGEEVVLEDEGAIISLFLLLGWGGYWSKQVRDEDIIPSPPF